MEVSPIDHFNNWFKEELRSSILKIPTACCLSTIGTDGYPNARYVSFKGIDDNNFNITGTTTSRKGIEINTNNKVALSFWWATTERQVRIQGNATLINDILADNYFSERSRDSQIVSIVSNQGEKLDDLEELHKKYREIESRYSNQPLTRPANWNGYAIAPVRIEFLQFRQTRFHERKLYELVNRKWMVSLLQP